MARCSVCGREPADLAVHEPGAPPRAFCAACAPLRLALGDSAGDAAVREGAWHANPDSAAAAYDLAALRLRTGRTGEAVALARRAVALAEAASPDALPLALELLAEALEAEGDRGAAEGAARRAAATAGAFGGTFAVLGRLVAARGDLAGAADAFEAGLAADPWCFECCRRAAVLRIARGEAERALGSIEPFLALTAPRTDEATGARVPPPEVIQVAPTVGEEAQPGAPPPATVRSFPSELAYRAALRREGARRSHVVAAARFQARILAGDAFRSLGRDDEAVESYEAAAGEIAGVSPVLLKEAGLDLQ